MGASDQLMKLIFDRFPVRGTLVRLESAWQSVQARNPLPRPASELLGQGLGAAALMTGNIKFDGKVGLQLQGSGVVSLLLTQCTHEGGVRGIARCEETLSPDADFSELTRDAVLTVIIEQRGGQRYQGIVPLDGDSLAAALRGYFEQSEQLQTRLWLASDDRHVAGLMLQRMPGEGGVEVDADGWNRVVQLAETLDSEELLALPGETIARRLYHEERVRIERHRLRFECSCSRERVEQVLDSIGREEILATLADESTVTVDCEFCNQRYSFDRVDLEALFNPRSVSRPTDTRQ